LTPVELPLQNYERLSRVYDLDWGDFSLQYLGLIDELLKNRNVAHANILDIACGTGRLASELARRGHLVVGVDGSRHMIAVATSRHSHMTNLRFSEMDMSELGSFGVSFHMITCTFDAINYLTSIEHVERMFQSVAALIRPGGLILFDSNTEWMYKNHNNAAHAYELGGYCFIQRMTYNAPLKEARTVFEFDDGLREIHIQRPYSLKELRPLLKQEGLRVLRAYANFKGRRYRNNSERLICVAAK
jgi:2-polyprenyl-3-methyl-5-hydroxy-6-metoxy-1,4-benzoquinol methylase